MAEGAGRGIEHSCEELLGLVEGKSQAEEIGAAGMGVFVVARRIGDGEFREGFPRRGFREKFFVGGFGGSDFDEIALRAAAAFEEHRGDRGGFEGARRIVIGKSGNEGFDFRQIGGEGIPPVVIAIVKDRAGAEDLLNASGILANDADHHVDQFVEAKGLFDDRTHGDIAGIVFGVANGNLLR